MDKNVLKQYLLNKGELWQHFFVTLFLQEQGLLLSDLREKPFKATTCLKFCNTFSELEDVWNLVDAVDEYFDDMVVAVNFIFQTKPVQWQYDFVNIISKICKIEIKQNLEVTPLITAYCWGLSLPSNAMIKIFELLDARHEVIYSSLCDKEKKLKRNLLLTLECYYSRRLNNAADSYNFRELLDAFATMAGSKGLLNALKLASTDETKLTEDETTCLGFMYRTPYFDDEVNLARNILPQSCLYARVHEFMRDMQNLKISQDIQALEDEDFDKYEDESIYLDPSENCVVNVHLDDVFYANVYIKRSEVSKNFKADFLVLRQNFLYTVEIVDDFSKIPRVREFVNEVEDWKRLLAEMERKLQSLPLAQTAERKPYLVQRAAIKRFLSSCYAVCYAE